MPELKKYNFSELYDMTSGISSKPEQAGHGHPFASFSTVFNNQFLPKTLPDLMDTSENDRKTYSIKKGDIFLTRTSETLDELGMSSVATEDIENATYSGFLKRIRPKQTDISYHKFMAFYLRSKLFRKSMNNNAIMTLRASLNEQIFSYLDLLLPTYKEQKKIGDYLYLISQKIELNNRIHAELEAMAKLIYDYWFVQFDFPDTNGLPYKSSGGSMVYNETLKREIPEGWEDKELSEIISRIGTGLNPRQHFKLGVGENYYVTIKNIDDGKVCINEKCDRIDDGALDIINRRSDLQAGDILFTSIEPVGTTYLIQEKPANWNINESVFTLRPNYDAVTAEFAYFLLSGKEIRAFTKNVAAGSIHKGIRIGVLNTFKFPFSNSDLVSRFSKISMPMLKQQYEIEQENRKLSELRDWLLPMLMNGQVTIKDD